MEEQHLLIKPSPCESLITGLLLPLPPSAEFSSSSSSSPVQLHLLQLLHQTGEANKQTLFRLIKVHLHGVLCKSTERPTGASVLLCFNRGGGGKGGGGDLIGNPQKNWAINNKHNCICTLVQQQRGDETRARSAKGYLRKREQDAAASPVSLLWKHGAQRGRDTTRFQ